MESPSSVTTYTPTLRDRLGLDQIRVGSDRVAIRRRCSIEQKVMSWSGHSDRDRAERSHLTLRALPVSAPLAMMPVSATLRSTVGRCSPYGQGGSTVNDLSAVDVVRRLYAAFAARDLDAVTDCLAEDAVWTLPGTSPIAGTHHGAAAIRDDFLAKLGPLSGGTLRSELLDVCMGDEYVVAVQHATAQHDGRSLDVTACQLMRVEGGRIVEVRGHYSDQAALDDFWQQ